MNDPDSPDSDLNPNEDLAKKLGEELEKHPVAWINPHICADCGSNRNITKHHEKKNGIRTGRHRYLCRDCHDAEEGIVEHALVRKVAIHKKGCQDRDKNGLTCSDHWNAILSHLKGYRLLPDGSLVKTTITNEVIAEPDTAAVLDPMILKEAMLPLQLKCHVCEKPLMYISEFTYKCQEKDCEDYGKPVVIRSY